MLLFAVIISLAFSASLTSSYQQCDEHFADQADATACCVAQGLELCSKNQLFQVVFGTDESYSQPQMCFSGYMTDAVGWWNADDGYCSGYGFKTYADPNGPGAHCCSPDVPAPAPMTCQTAGPSVCWEPRILLASQMTRYCADGDCIDEFCCQDFTPAEVYAHVGDQSAYATAADASAGCTDTHPDYQLCTKTQILALYGAGYGKPVCSSGWHVADDDEDNEFARGWYNNEQTAADGYCGGKTGWRAWAPATGEGSAHCCVPSYTKGSGYYSLGDLAGKDIDEKQVIARAHCEASSYPYTLCTQRQLFQVAYTGEAENICMSGILDDPLPEDAGDSTCGWEQVSTDCGNGSVGWKGWCPDYTGAHCCLDYVSGWYPEYTKATSGYDIYPADKLYVESDFNNGAAANTWCMGQGYAGVCTVEQVKYVAENQASYGNLGCAVGWSTETDGSYVSGYWGTACGNADEWYYKWQPTAPQYPLAQCCDVEVPSSSRVPAALDPLVKQVSNYAYATASDAEGMCDATNGYSTCTRDQVETVATVGVERSDGTMQTETNLCYQGWMADGSKGWYQTDASCGNGKTGWRSFNGDAGLFCCLAFETQLGTEAPTKTPSVPVYQFIGEYEFGTEELAQAGCQAVNADYTLCSDDMVYTIASFGSETDAEGFSSVQKNTDCTSGWVDSNESEPEYYVGWFQTDPACGGGRKYLQWNAWALADTESPSGITAGAHCCVADLIVAQPHPETTTTTTTEEVEETVAPSAVPTPEPTTTTTTEETSGPSAMPTEWIATSDLPSSSQPPAGCVDRPDLVPMGFEGVLQYCATEDMIYINGRTTCVDPTEADAEALVSNAFINDWYFAHGTCEGRKEYDLATDDQLYVTNHMLDDLETDIDQLESEMATESADLDAYLETWKTDVASLITDNMSNFDATTQAALQAYIDSNLGSD